MEGDRPSVALSPLIKIKYPSALTLGKLLFGSESTPDEKLIQIRPPYDSEPSGRTMILLLRAIGIWLLLVIAAIINGALRENLLINLLGETLALPVSGVLLSMLIFLITFLLISSLTTSKPTSYLAIGLLWVTFTLSFEFIFGHYFLGKPWREITAAFDPSEGNLFILIILVTLLSPWVAAKTRNLI